MATLQVFSQRIPAGTNSATTYVVPICEYQAGGWALATVRPLNMRWTGAFSNVVIRLDSAPGAGKSHVYTIQLNGADTGLTITIADLATTGRAAVPVPIVPGNTLLWKRVLVGGALPIAMAMTCEFSHAAPNVNMHVGTTGLTGASTLNGSLFRPGYISATTLGNRSEVVAAPGTLSEVDFVLDAAPGAGGSGKKYVIGVAINGTLQDGTGGAGGSIDTRVTILETATTGRWTGSLALTAGQRVALQYAPTLSPAAANVQIGVTFLPTVDGESNCPGILLTNLATSGTDYPVPAQESGTAASATEATYEVLVGYSSFILRAMRLRLSGTVSTGPVAFTTRKNRATPFGGPAITLTAGQQEGNDSTGSVSLVDGDEWGIQYVATGTPGVARVGTWTWVMFAIGSEIPVADAGPDQIVTLPTGEATMAGSATALSAPSPPTFTYLWSLVSGPGTATFVDATDPLTKVTFSVVGTYVLKLLATSSSGLWDDDTMSVLVIAYINPDETCPSGPISISINGVDKTDRLKVSQLSIEYTLGSRGVLECLLVDTGPPVSAYRPVLGQVVAVTKGIRMFTGRLLAWDEEPLVDTNSGTGIRITVGDYHRALGSRHLTKSYGAFHHTVVTPATAATAEVRPGGDNTAMLLTSRELGTSINNKYSLQLVVRKSPGTSTPLTGQTLSVVDAGVGNYIAYLATDGSGNVTTTPNLLAADATFNPPTLNPVYWITNDSGSDGSGKLSDHPQTFLDGAEDTIYDQITTLEVVTIGTGNPALVTTKYPHGLATGATVRITDVIDVAPDISAMDLVATVTGDATFTIPVNVTTAGTGGTVSQLTRLNAFVADIAAALVPYGISLQQMVTTGPWVMPRVYTRQTCEFILNDVCTEIGWIFRVTPDKILQVFEPGTLAAPFSLTDTNAQVRGGTVQRRTQEQYANTAIVECGEDGGTKTYNETFYGDGSTRVFPLAAVVVQDTAIASPGNVFDYRATAWRHVGVWGVDTLFEWVYRREDNSLVQLASYAGGTPGVVLEAGESIRFEYIGETRFAVTVPDDVALAADGGEPYEILVEGGNRDFAAARVYGALILSKYSILSRVLTVATTACMGLPGSAVTMSLASRLISGDWLIRSVRAEEQEAVEGGPPVRYEILYTYELLENGTPDTWVDFWKRFQRRNN